MLQLSYFLQRGLSALYENEFAEGMEWRSFLHKVDKDYKALVERHWPFFKVLLFFLVHGVTVKIRWKIDTMIEFQGEACFQKKFKECSC